MSANGSDSSSEEDYEDYHDELLRVPNNRFIVEHVGGEDIVRVDQAFLDEQVRRAALAAQRKKNAASKSASGSDKVEKIEIDSADPANGVEPKEPEEEFIWPSTLPHPLLIPDVLRDIMDKLGMQDVEHCREVSHGWNSECCGILQQKKIVALMEIESVKYYLDKMGSTIYFPHSHFELHMENILEQNYMRKFWTTFGPSIKILDLRQSALLIERLFELISQYLPNLEKLTLRSLPRRISLRRNSHPPLPLPIPLPGPSRVLLERELRPPKQPTPPVIENWASLRFPQIKELTLSWCPQEDEVTLGVLKDLMRSMPNLERLFVVDIPSGGQVVHIGGNYAAPPPPPTQTGSKARVSRMIIQVLIDPTINLSQLKVIDFPVEVGNAELEKLKDKHYGFNNISLKLANGVKSSNLTAFLHSLNGTLQDLELRFPDGFFNCGITFPAYTQMKPPEAALYLQKIKTLTLHCFCGPLESLKNLGNLQKLTVNSARLDTFVSAFVLPGVNRREHKLKTLRMDSAISHSAIVSLSTCFPLLRILKVAGIDDGGLGIIYRNLPYLIELEIVKGKISDQGISGVPLEVCKDMAETATFNFVEPAKFRCDLFLGSLQYLKTLKLVCDEVSDISIVFGIIDCTNLENLTLHSPSISDVGLFKIADKMTTQLMYLDIHECENVSEEGKFYCKEKMKQAVLVLEAFSLQKQKTIENPLRQVGFPSRGRCRPERSYMSMEEDFERFPERERIILAMDRRRRYFGLIGARFNRHVIAAVGNGENAAADGNQPPLPVNEEELAMMMELNHPMFNDDEGAGHFFMNFEGPDTDSEDDDDDEVEGQGPIRMDGIQLQQQAADMVQANDEGFDLLLPMNFEFVGQDGEAMQEDIAAHLPPANDNVEENVGNVQEDNINNDGDGAIVDLDRDQMVDPIDLMRYLEDDYGAL